MAELQYAGEMLDIHQDRVAIAFLRLSVACAILPMLIGVAIVILYWLFDWDFLVDAGLLMLPLGAMAVLLGLSFVISWVVRKRTIAKRSGTTMKWRGFAFLVVLLLSNFGVAVVCVGAGIQLMTVPTVSVQLTNDSPLPIDRCAITAAGHEISVGPVAAGSITGATFKANRITRIHVHLEQGGVTRDFYPPLPTNYADGGECELHIKKGLELKSDFTVGGRD